MRTKEERLANKARLKKNRRHYWGQDLLHHDKFANMVTDTPAICSCWMCGNARKYFGHRTLQEISFDELSKIV